MKRPSGGGFEYHLLVVVTLGLVAFGLVMVYSASSARAALAADDPAYYLKRQAVYALLGIVALVAFSRTDYRRLRYLVPPLLLASFVLLVAVLVVGTPVNGAQALARPSARRLSSPRSSRSSRWRSGSRRTSRARRRRARSVSSSARSGSCSAPLSRSS